MDVIRSEAVKKLAETCTKIPFEASAIAEACRSGYEVKLETEGKPVVYVQTYEVEGGRLVMLLNTDRRNAYKNVGLDLGKGKYLECWDARSGRVTVPEYNAGKTVTLTIDLEAGGERLYLITDQKRELMPEESFVGTEPVELPDTFAYTLTEENICVLDMVSLTDSRGVEIPCMEVLKADRKLRDHYGIPYRGGEMLQPWYQVKYTGGNTELISTVFMKYTVEAKNLPGSAVLAVEDLAHIRRIQVNGADLALESRGKWIDICFDKVEIPGEVFKTGENTIVIEMDYYKTSGIEAVYLLGDFGVKVKGDKAVLDVLPERLMIGDITNQGLPFYSGSVIYHVEGLQGQHVSVTAGDFGGSLVKLLGDDNKIIAFPPYKTDICSLSGLEVVLTRRNTFGPLHQKPKHAWAYAPDNFMTEGSAWSPDYELYEQGLLKKPSMRSVKIG